MGCHDFDERECTVCGNPSHWTKDCPDYKPPPEPRECWCPCFCGGREPYWEINKDGLCPSCADPYGTHEVPPEGVNPSRELILRQLKSAVRFYEKVVANGKR